MPKSVKYFMLFQMAGRVHEIVEIYLKRVQTERVIPILKNALLYLIMLVMAYETYLWKTTILLLTLDSLQRTVFSSARLVKYYINQESSMPLFQLWNVTGILCPATAIYLLVYQCYRNAIPSNFYLVSTVMTILGIVLELCQLRALYVSYCDYCMSLPASKEVRKKAPAEHNNNGRSYYGGKKKKS